MKPFFWQDAFINVFLALQKSESKKIKPLTFLKKNFLRVLRRMGSALSVRKYLLKVNNKDTKVTTFRCLYCSFWTSIWANIYMFKVKTRNTRKCYEKSSKSTIKTYERRHWLWTYFTCPSVLDSCKFGHVFLCRDHDHFQNTLKPTYFKQICDSVLENNC